eukprot:365803-Chlamydomonas_euryale.AAC.1
MPVQQDGAAVLGHVLPALQRKAVRALGGCRLGGRGRRCVCGGCMGLCFFLESRERCADVNAERLSGKRTASVGGGCFGACIHPSTRPVLDTASPSIPVSLHPHLPPVLDTAFPSLPMSIPLRFLQR